MSRHPSIWCQASNVLLFLIALVATCNLLGRFQPPVDPNIAGQCRFFRERKDEYDTIFIGSSRIKYQVDPKLFDAETARLGAPTHSLNLAFPGMWPPESYYYLRQFLAARPKHLRWVVIEVMDYRFGQVENVGVSRRTMVWHDWKHTGIVCRRILESPWPANLKSLWLARHAHCFLVRSVDPGRGADWLQARYFPPKQKKESDSGIMPRAGFDPKPTVAWNEATHSEFAQSLQEFEQSPPLRVRPGLASALADLATEVRRARAEPIFVLAPTTRPEEKLVDGLPTGVTTWAFHQPSAFPRFYLPALRYDPVYFNEEGAREFTTLLAQRFAALAQKR